MGNPGNDGTWEWELVPKRWLTANTRHKDCGSCHGSGVLGCESVSVEVV